MSKSEKEVLEEVHKAFMGFLKRAEKNTEEVLTNTFVDTAPLLDSLSTANSQVIYGRRGTGKTHALKYLASEIAARKELPIYLDLRKVGSNGALYADTSKPPVDRAIGLILDMLSAIADDLYTLAVEIISDAPHPEQITNRLDDLAKAIGEVKLDGEVVVERRELIEEKASGSQKAQIELSKDKASIGASGGRDKSSMTVGEIKTTNKGNEQRRLNFGTVQTALESLVAVLGNPRVWLLIDEWSEVPIDLQPYLADLLRRTVAPLNRFVIKIAAIEHRSAFSIVKSRGEYIGLELGADVAADVNLDDFLVFDNDQARSVAFFKQLIFSHYKASGETMSIKSADELIRVAFTQGGVFEELVRAAEGVPRDAINLVAKLGGKCFGAAATAVDIRKVARDWYQQDKASIFKASPELDSLMTGIIEEVIGERRARAFLFDASIKDEHIERLFDSRIIHVLKRSVSSKDDPGKKFIVYKIDYGCYVDLINTKQAPQGLFAIIFGDKEVEEWVEVPADDYRSIRRAILTPEDIKSFMADAGQEVGGPSAAGSSPAAD